MNQGSKSVSLHMPVNVIQRHICVSRMTATAGKRLSSK